MPVGCGMMVTGICEEGCRVFSTKSRCPCLMDFRVRGSRQSRSLYKRVKTKQSIDDASFLPRSSFWEWIRGWFCLPVQNSVDIEPFPHPACSILSEEKMPPDQYRVLIKTNEAMKQEEMASHLIDEVAPSACLHRRFAPFSRRRAWGRFCGATRSQPSQNATASSST